MTNSNPSLDSCDPAADHFIATDSTIWLNVGNNLSHSAPTGACGLDFLLDQGMDAIITAVRERKRVL